MGGASTENSDVPPVTTPAGEYTLQTIAVGCKVTVRRPIGDDFEERKAEILSVREKQQSIYAPVSDDPADATEFYIHYVEFNKRLDEWIPGSRVILTKDLEWPKPKAASTSASLSRKDSSHPTTNKKSGSSRKTTKKASKAAAAAAKAAKRASATPGVSSHVESPLKHSTPAIEFVNDLLRGDTPMADGDDEDAEGEAEPMDEDLFLPDSQMQSAEREASQSQDPNGSMVVQPSDPQKPPPVHSKKQEIEKLRTSGSMTQNVHEVARVKNLNKLQIGKHLVEAWYFSPYPTEFSHLPILYICEFCLSYMPSPVMFARHRTKCNLVHPPGNEIYRHEDISFFEIDGKKQLTWCRNLSLLSKCFLDHKTLYYDVQPFLYYVMVKRDTHGCHILGYFSKEKESAEGYNLACILTLPQHQRFGYGRLLIEFSYELSKRESKVGSPEKPLSDLGLISYRAYWAEKVMEYLLETDTAEISLDEIATKTAITQADIHYTLLSMQMIKTQRNNLLLCLTPAAKEAYAKSQAKVRRRIEPNALQWKPPYFSRDQLRAWAY